MKKSLLIALLLVSVASAGLLFWRGVTQQAFGNSEEAQAAPPPVRPVPTECVRRAPSASIREFPATVQATRRVDMSLSVGGVLIELNGEAGRVVEKGEIIARLDPRDFQNELNSAQARYDEALQNLQRTRTLRKQNVTTESELDSAEAAYETAQAELHIRRKALEDTVMRAPFDGVVAKRYVENHEHIKENAPILSLQSIASLEVSFQVPERLLSRYGDAALD
ncbi:MAG: efflux RND transporter periplasmic adaptor subunit, partial [Oceanidesulfovibrio sp.]